jgi:hypothetical protein
MDTQDAALAHRALTACSFGLDVPTFKNHLAGTRASIGWLMRFPSQHHHLNGHVATTVCNDSTATGNTSPIGCSHHVNNPADEQTRLSTSGDP